MKKTRSPPCPKLHRIMPGRGTQGLGLLKRGSVGTQREERPNLPQRDTAGVRQG